MPNPRSASRVMPWFALVVVVGGLTLASCARRPGEPRHQGSASSVVGVYGLLSVAGSALPTMINNAQQLHASSIELRSDGYTFRSTSTLAGVRDTFVTRGNYRLTTSDTVGYSAIRLDGVSPFGTIGRDTLAVRFESGTWIYRR